MKILVRPCYDVALNNRLFLPQDPRADHHKIPWFQWKIQAEKQGIYIDTWDVAPLAEADIILIQDLPASKATIIQAKEAAPNAVFIFQLYESPIDRLHFHDARNLDLFDAVITYNRKICDDKYYFYCPLPIGIPDNFPVFKKFYDRRSLAMINTNIYSGWLAQRGQGITGLPALGPYFGGWKISSYDLLSQDFKNLYSKRRKVAALAEKEFPELLDIYGYGWQGEPSSWIHKILPAKSYQGAKGRTQDSKLDTLSNYRFTLAFENLVSDCGYISEKIFDAFYAGSVPIYLGDQDINNYIPEDAFIDARRFKDIFELLYFVKNCSESDWLKMYHAGQEYIHSTRIQIFQTQSFVDRMIELTMQIFQQHRYTLN